MLRTVCAGIFAYDHLGVLSGQGYGEVIIMSLQLYVQLVGVMSTVIYKAFGLLSLLKLVANLLGFRIDSKEETQGLDLVEPDGRGYDL